MTININANIPPWLLLENKKGTNPIFERKALITRILALINPPRKIGARNSGISRNEDFNDAWYNL